jgi:integrase
MQTHLEAYLASRKRFISPNYFRDSSAVLKAWRREIGTNAEPVSREALEAWTEAKLEVVKISTVAAYLFAVRQFLDWCKDRGLRSDNPALAIKLPQHHKPFRKVFVSKSTVRMLIQSCADLELRYCLYCGFHAGLRFGEVVASRPEWFSLGERLLQVTRSKDFDTKNHDDRTVPLTEEFHSFLRLYGLRSPFMIGPHKKRAAAHRYRFDFSARFEHYVRSQGVYITFHDCRRTFASLHVSSGTSPYKVAKWLGDTFAVVERHYGHLEPSDREVNRAFVVNYDKLFP